MLYRNNNMSRIIEEKLLFENVPYQLVGGTDFYKRKEVKDVVCYLKALANPYDDNAIKRIVNVPKRGIGDTSINRLAEFAIENDMNLYDAMLDVDEVPGMSRAADKIRGFVNLMESLKLLMEEGSLVELYDAVLDKTGYVEELNAEGTDEAKARVENILELKNKVVKYVDDMEGQGEYPTLTGLLEEISLVADAEDSDGEESEKVVLMTLHRAKGLEFPYVFIVAMEDRLFPSSSAVDSDDPDNLEEERRLCYVGITRAMKKLYLSAASQRMINGVTSYLDISRFVKEIPGDYLDAQGAYASRTSVNREKTIKPADGMFTGIGYGRPQMKKNDYAKSNPYSAKPNPSANPGFGKAFPMGGGSRADYRVGDVVKHIKFGKGTVTEVVPAGSDSEITVDFERVGEKKMFASLVKMKKL